MILRFEGIGYVNLHLFKISFQQQRLEEDIEIFAEITEEMEQENFAKRNEIEELLNNLSQVKDTSNGGTASYENACKNAMNLFICSQGSSKTHVFDEDQAKSRADVDLARSNLKWANEELKKLEKEIREADLR